MSYDDDGPWLAISTSAFFGRFADGRVETCSQCSHVAEVHGGEKGCTGWDASHIGGICGCPEVRPFPAGGIV